MIHAIVFSNKKKTILSVFGAELFTTRLEIKPQDISTTPDISTFCY